MRANVFTDAALAKHAGRFVWLSIDTEAAGNAPFLEKFPIEAWPTLLVVDARSEVALLKWLGSAGVPELTKLLEDGERAASAERRTEPADLLAEAHRLNARGRGQEAAQAFRRAIESGGKEWEGRPRAIESLIGVLQTQKKSPECVQVAVDWGDNLPRGSSFGNVAASGLACALDLEDEKARKAAVAVLEPRLVEAVALPTLLADDRSGYFEVLIDSKEAAGDVAGSLAMAERWLVFLEEAAASAATPAARAVFDAHRVAAALKLKDPARALPALEASERDFPEDYNPPARRAIVLRELGRYDEALDAGRRALAKVEGPRRVRILENQATIFVAKGDPGKARECLTQALAFIDSLPQAQRSEKARDRVRGALAKLEGR